MRILALESSCDESAAAVLDSEDGLLAHELFSQVELHRIYGGVVPELASRDHVHKLLPLVRSALAKAGEHVGSHGGDGLAGPRVASGRAQGPHGSDGFAGGHADQHVGAGTGGRARVAGVAIDGIAYTAGPGLIGALLTGAALARSLAYAWNVPAIAVHHLEGHLLAPLLEDNPPPFPHVALLVSGGHTMLIEVQGIGRYERLGESRDDAAGEAFDKTAKLLGLPYPGGPELARIAGDGKPGVYEFPRPMLDRPGLEFSFSGLKTAVLHAVRAQPSLSDGLKADVAHGVQEAIVETLVAKSLRALDQTGLDDLVVSGGVSANRALRARLADVVSRRGGRVYYPRIEFCTDNAAMIAVAGLARLQAGQHDSLVIKARAQWPLESLPPL